ncbi:MAG: MBL fold metallo-hydrolase [Desulfobacterales bacterium]|nr:MAG: MBL fold metallo-hydrolase [Desulfobacterales bacterium]
MIVNHSGKVTDRILLLGRKESCVYLLKGKREYVLLGGGMAYIIPDVLEQMRYFKIEEKKIQRIIILHSHFDHCGMVPYFKQLWPWLRVTASDRAKELLTTPKVMESIEFLNRVLLSEHGLEKKAKEMEIGFTGVEVETVVKDGDIILCDDLSMEVIDVPGHSSCSIAIYVSQEKAMFASDAGGIPIGRRVFTAANSNFDKYQKSIEKMAGYDIDIYLAEHFGARVGADARGYLFKSMGAAKETRRIMEASYDRTKDVKKSTEEMTDMFMEWVPENFMPRDIIALVAGQMLRYIAKQKSGGKSR